MRDDEVPAHVERTRAEYAADIERNGGVSHEEATAKATRDVGALFPDGRPARGQFLRVIELLESGRPIGRVHYTERPPGSRRAWLYDIALDEDMRGRGLGREAMLLFEEELRAHGFTSVALNVFGGNERARSLYRSLGYREVALEMTKELEE